MRFVSDAQVASVLSAELAYGTVREGLTLQARGLTGTSTPSAIFLNIDQSRSMAVKGAYVGGLAGFRLAGEVSHRTVDAGRLLACYDAATLKPLAVVEESSMYRLRVGAQIAVAIQELCRPVSATLALIGAGRLALSTLEVLSALGVVDHVKIFSRQEVNRRRLAAAFNGQFRNGVQAVSSIAEACDGADVIVTLTSAQAPFLNEKHWGGGTLLVSAGGGWECDKTVYESADRLVVDDWAQCRIRGDLAELAEQGEIGPEAVTATLADAVSGKVPRCRPDERVVVVTQGLTFLDVALAGAVIARIGNGPSG